MKRLLFSLFFATMVAPMVAVFLAVIYGVLWLAFNDVHCAAAGIAFLALWAGIWVCTKKGYFK